MEVTLPAYNDGLVCLDELHQMTPKEASKIPLMVGNQRGKLTSTRNRKTRPVNTWRVALLSSGNIDLETKLKEAGFSSEANQEVRFISIPVDGFEAGCFNDTRGEAPAFYVNEMLKPALEAHYGTAGPAFLEKLCRDRGAADRLKRYAKAWLADCSVDIKNPQVGRIADMFAAIAAAGRLACDYGILPFYGSDIHAAVNRMLQAAPMAHVKGSIEEAKAVENILHYIDTRAHGEMNQWNLPMAANAPRTGSFNEDGQFRDYYFLHKPLVTIAGASWAVVKKALLDSGLMVEEDSSVNPRQNGYPQSRYHVIQGKVIEAYRGGSSPDPTDEFDSNIFD
jgi:hypothetical protein